MTEVPGRDIVHLDMDTFFVSVERLLNSKLEGKPVIIGSTSGRGVVASCSYESRHFGVRSAMPMKMALQLCPDAVVIRGDMETYSKYSSTVTQIIAEKAPAYEKASIDEHYIDISGMDRFFGCYKWSHQLRDTIIRETGLPVSFGLSANKTVAKVATGEAKPNGELFVQHNQIISFLAPLSIRKIPMIGEKTYINLRNLGIDKVGVLQQMPIEMMEKLMGKNGIIIWKRARGIDETPVYTQWEQKSMSSEHTFEQDTIDIRQIEKLITKMVEALCYDLRSSNKLTACITIKIRYSNFDTHSLQKKIPYTAFDHVLIHIARELFHKLYTRRMLIRLVGVRFSHLVNGAQQLNMFEDTAELANLYQTIDHIKRRFGRYAIQRAT
ncbi:MAG: DNA polymerase IV [Bacteroidota bacterium]